MPSEKDRARAIGNMLKNLVKFGRKLFEVGLCVWTYIQTERQTLITIKSVYLYLNMPSLPLCPPSAKLPGPIAIAETASATVSLATVANLLVY